MVPYAREQLEERVRIIDGVMNLGYGKRTMYSLRIFVPTLASFPTQTKVTKSIKVIRGTDRRDVANKCVQTDFAVETGYEGDDRQQEGVNIGDQGQGDNKDVEEKSPILFAEKIEYILKIESLQ